MNSAGSSTGRTGRSGWSRSLRCWSPCSVRTTRPTAPHPTAGCSGGTRGGPLSESVYGRAWHAARTLALGPELAASGLARRPYDLRHAALSLWLNAGGDPAQIAARAGHSVAVLLTVYSHCIHGHDDLLNQQIDHVLEPPAGRGPCPSVESQRLHRPRDGHGRCPLYVREFPARPADGPDHADTKRAHVDTPPQPISRLPSSDDILESRSNTGGCGPGSGPRWPTDHSKRSAEPLALHVKAGDTIRRHRL